MLGQRSTLNSVSTAVFRPGDLNRHNRAERKYKVYVDDIAPLLAVMPLIFIAGKRIDLDFSLGAERVLRSPASDPPLATLTPLIYFDNSLAV